MRYGLQKMKRCILTRCLGLQEEHISLARRGVGIFFTAILWVINGLTYVTLLFTTGEWVRLVPTSWNIFPEAFQTFVSYMSFHLPPASAFNPYDPLQQLTYFSVIFIFAPFMILTGLALAPAVAARFPWYIKMFGGKQAARSLHFLGLVGIIVFIVIHLSLVAIVNSHANLLNITLGDPYGNYPLAVAILASAIVFVILFNVWATWYTLRNERKVQNALDPIINFFTGLLAVFSSQQHYTQKDISPYFRVNGRPPKSAEWAHHAENNFKDWKLEIKGLVEKPGTLSLADLRTLFTKSEQITKHHCIQGWSAIAQWNGVLMSELLKKVVPLPEARYVLFRAYDTDENGREYYETFTLDEMMKPQSLLAYEMNEETLPLVHGAPLRIRAESKLGFKMVKYLKSIEIIDDYSKIGAGKGGYKEDVEFFDVVASI